MEYIISLKDTGGKKVYVDPGEREGVFLYPGEIKKLRLQEGSRLEAETFEQIRKEYAIPRAKKRALGILAKKDRTEKELRDKLKESLHDEYSLEEAMLFVKSFGYVDDYAYAKDYLYFKKKKKSYLQIRRELKEKGISGQILEIVFEEAGTQELEDIRPHVEKYMKKFSEIDTAALQKTCAYFYRKGYSTELVREIIDNFIMAE